MLKFGRGQRRWRRGGGYGREGEKRQERSWFWVTNQLLDGVQNFTDWIHALWSPNVKTTTGKIHASFKYLVLSEGLWTICLKTSFLSFKVCLKVGWLWEGFPLIPLWICNKNKFSGNVRMGVRDSRLLLTEVFPFSETSRVILLWNNIIFPLLHSPLHCGKGLLPSQMLLHLFLLYVNEGLL